MIIRNILYAILLGVGMAACLSQNEEGTTEGEAKGNSVPSATETTNTAPDPAMLVVQKGKVGNITIGMPIDQVRQQVAAGTVVQDTMLEQEGQQATAYVLYTQGGQHEGLLVEQVCEPDCKVSRISVLSSEFKTPKGVGVGSKYSEVKQAYPIGTVSFEEGNFVAVSEEAGMSFILDETQLPQDNSNKGGRYDPENIPANTLVKRVLLY